MTTTNNILGYEVLSTNGTVSTIKADLFEVFERLNAVAATHCANCYHTMGSGIARIIREKYPKAYEADCVTKIGADKLGTYSLAKINHEKHQYIVNLYGQNLFTRNSLGDRDVSYDAMYDSLRALLHTCNNAADVDYILIPWSMGSDLAGGKWAIIEQMIATLAEDKTEVAVIICRLPSTL